MVDRQTRTSALWASVAGLCFIQAYLWSGWAAWLGALALAGALRPLRSDGWKRRAVGAITLSQLWVGALGGWGFAYHSFALYGAQAAYLTATGALIGVAAVAGAPARPSPVRLCLAWTAVEWLRQLGPVGFPLTLGGTQAELPIRSAMATVGAVGLSGLMVGTALALVQAVRPLSGWPGRSAGLRALGWVATCLVLTGLGRWQPGLAADGPPVSVSVVQGGMPAWIVNATAESWVAERLVRRRYADLSRLALSEPPDLLVLPESPSHRTFEIRDGQVPEPLFSTPRRGRAGGTLVLAGAYVDALAETDGQERFVTSNSVLAFFADEPFRVRGRVDKRQLAPIAEAGLADGHGDGVLAWNGRGIGVLVCYESMFPRLAREQSANASLLAILTNDAGFRHSPIGWTHARQGWSRAVEVGRPLVRAAQAGVSLIVDGRGRPMAQLGLFEAGVIGADVQPMTGPTWFSRVGYLVGPISVALVVVLALLPPEWPPRRRRRARATSATNKTA